MLGSLGRTVLGLLALGVAVPVAAAAALILLPPLGEAGWLLRVVLTEWSLLLMLPALLGLLLAAAAWWAGIRRIGFVAALLAVLAMVAAGVQPVRGAISASDHGVDLDLIGYAAGPSFGAGRPDETHRYATAGGKALRLDVWEPRNRLGPRPGLIFVHGGGWVGGERSGQPQWDRWFAGKGIVVFDIDYRLAGPDRPTWRQAPGDVKCAVAWVRRNAERYGVDPGRLVLMGTSAGGHLAMLAAYSGDVLPSSCPETGPGVGAGTDPGGGDGPARVSRVIALYPPTHLASAYGDQRPWWYATSLWNSGLEFLRSYTGGTPATRPEAYRLSEPNHYLRRGLPPTLLIQGGNDLIVPAADTGATAAALERTGDDHRYVEIAYAGHTFDVSWGGFGTQVARHAITEFVAPLTRTPR